MKKNTHPLTRRIVLIISLISFNYAVMAAPQITDDQILRVAKIARNTGTNITIIKETTTVKVYGSNKKTTKKVKRTVIRFMKQKKKGIGLTDSDQDTPEFTSKPPALDNTPTSSLRRPPVLDEQGLY